MKFEEAIKTHRQRNLLPEEQVIAAQIAEHDSPWREYLDDALARALAIDSGDRQAENWQHQVALLDLIQRLAREVVEYDVRLRTAMGRMTELAYQQNRAVAELRGSGAIGMIIPPQPAVQAMDAVEDWEMPF